MQAGLRHGVQVLSAALALLLLACSSGGGTGSGGDGGNGDAQDDATSDDAGDDSSGDFWDEAGDDGGGSSGGHPAFAPDGCAYNGTYCDHDGICCTQTCTNNQCSYPPKPTRPFLP